MKVADLNDQQRRACEIATSEIPGLLRDLSEVATRVDRKALAKTLNDTVRPLYLDGMEVTELVPSHGGIKITFAEFARMIELTKKLDMLMDDYHDVLEIIK